MTSQSWTHAIWAGLAVISRYVSQTRVSLQLLDRVQGPAHVRQRKLLNPVFSITHMDRILPIFYGVAYRVRSSSYPHRYPG